MVGKTGLQVRTDTALMGVRGTTFDVASSPAGDFMVATSAGRVECQYQDRTLFSAPGSYVEVLPQNRVFHSVPVDNATLDAAEAAWVKTRVAAFQANAPKAFQAFSRRYQQYFGQLSRAEDRINSEAGAVLKLWKSQDANGTVSATPDLLREKNTVIGPLLGAHTPIFFLERIVYRLQELRSYLQDGTLSPSLEVTRGYTAKEFFKQWDKDQAVLSAWLSDYRFALKLFSERNGGSFPTDSTAESDFTKDNDFFN